MNIIDTNVIELIFSNDIDLQEDYFITPDIEEEADLTQILHNRKLSENIKPLTKYRYFDYSIYLDKYNKALNMHAGRSFFNMTGFGDISIIAALHTLTTVFDNMNRGQLFPFDENIILFTNDAGLIKRISSEFNRNDIIIKSENDIK